MDTRFWGPSGWQLLHMVTFTKGLLAPKTRFFRTIQDVLPCKYCRASTKEFVKDMPLDTNFAMWVYKLHDKVNQKLHKQHEEDPESQQDPVPSPSFEEVVEKYRKIMSSDPEGLPGRDFLLSVAQNFDPEQHNVESHRIFWKELKLLYPFWKFRQHVEIPDFSSQKTYFKDVYNMFKKMGMKESFKSVSQHLAQQKSGCNKKTQKGKTCRRTAGGGLTKRRDPKKTQRVSHARLL